VPTAGGESEADSEYSELENRKFTSAAIADALIDGDADAIREILLSHLEQVPKHRFFKEAG
jgi:DNA-binding GntR family transcriptional regulator